MNSELRIKNYLRAMPIEAVALLLAAVVVAVGLAVRGSALAGAPANVIYRSGPVIDTPAITIAGATVDTTSTPTTGAKEAHVIWTFGTVSGTYTTCTAQAKTSYDGTNYLTLGSAQSLTVTSTTINAWDIYQQAPVTSGVTNTTTSATAATGFGQTTKFTFACSGAYGTAAPVTIAVIYR